MSDARKAYERSQALTDADGAPDTASPEQAAAQPTGGEPTEPSPEQNAPGNGRVGVGDEPATEGAAQDEVGAADAVDTGAEAAAQADAPEGADSAVEDELTRALRERDEYLDHLRRERAEFENFRKRTARDKLEAMDRGVQSLLTELLGVLDDFGHVLAASEDSSDPALAKGIALVHNQLTGVLTRFGLEEVPGEGEPFDPQWHEAMMQVPADDDAEEPVVAQVLRPGYRFRGRVIRPASVSVAQ